MFRMNQIESSEENIWLHKEFSNRSYITPIFDLETLFKVAAYPLVKGTIHGWSVEKLDQRGKIHGPDTDFMHISTMSLTLYF